MEGDGARRIPEGLVRVQAGDVVPADLLLLTANHRRAARPGASADPTARRDQRPECRVQRLCPRQSTLMAAPQGRRRLLNHRARRPRRPFPRAARTVVANLPRQMRTGEGGYLDNDLIDLKGAR
ncbi:hypothetical protein GCM10023176_58590 [Micromonospora coerulea]|uniref:P-type E1-E2 ATPase n=1 Tax=Micromonospora coerulea TaxID=47856 RepID=A0ABP8T1V5_9ACTN